MKSLILSVFSVFALAGASHAQQKVSAKAEISTPTVQCDMCKEKVEKVLFREPGVTSAKVNIKKKTTTVTWLTDRTNIENIKTAIANAGYDADDVAAEESAYKRLPKCCKKPVTETPSPVE